MTVTINPASLPANLAGRVNAFNASVGSGGVPADIHSLIQEVLRESYIQMNEDLAFYAQKVKFFNETKKAIRGELERARNALRPVAGKEDDASLPSVFNPEIPNTEYVPGNVPTTGSNTAGLDDTAPDNPDLARYNELMSAWRGSDLVDNNHSYSTVGETGDHHKKNVKDGDVYNTMMEGGGQTWADNLVAWFTSLPPAEQKALVDKWQTEGMRFRVHVKETDWKDETYTYDKTRKLPAGTDPVAWLAAECDRATKDAASGIGAKDGGGSLDLSTFSFNAYPGSTSTRDLPPKPQELLDLETRLGLGESSGGYTAPTVEYTQGEPCKTKADLDTYITNMEEKLSSVGDDAQLANVDLQNALQKQQQTLQLMSNVSKMLHDTGMAIIRKIGG